MRKILYLSIILLSLACSKNKFIAPEGYDKFIGTWESINSDEHVKITIFDNGLVEEKFEIHRSGKHKFEKCLIDQNSFISTIEFFNSKNSNSANLVYYKNINGDTLHKYAPISNPNGNSLIQEIYFVKVL